MARATSSLISKLREAAARIESSSEYNWGNPARCNCGHLAQCFTEFSSRDLYREMQSQALSEWSEYANDYCPASGAPVDAIMDLMFRAGLERADIHQLEYLSNPTVLRALPGGFRYLRKGHGPDVALYLRTWAGLLELNLKEESAKNGAPELATAH